jgi:predicted metalloprotease with PDZ domain
MLVSFRFRRSPLVNPLAFLSSLLLGIAIVSFAQSSPGPQPVPLPPPIPPSLDTLYPGTITLAVDATNVNGRIATVHETLPVKPGKLILLYPEWFPGGHAPADTIARLAGLVVTANGKRIPWVRDRVNMRAFHIDVPQGTATLDLDFQYLAQMKPEEGRISSKIADLSWFCYVLYPAGHFSRQIHLSPSLRIPEGWKLASALEVKSQDGNLIRFKDVTLNTLIDSPVYAGINFKRVDLSTDPDNPVYLDVFADAPANLEITPEELQHHQNMVKEAQKLFRSRHYDHYDFLLSVSDSIPTGGLEHHQSSEDGARANYFTDWSAGAAHPSHLALLPHEYVHSWNGKFRRPADLWTPNFNVPMQNDLLWVYEGMTEYYGVILAARSGMCTAEQIRDKFAIDATAFAISPGRTWRPLADTTNLAIIDNTINTDDPPQGWPTWLGTFDAYYYESALIWLDADTKIRELSGEQKSLDDFARLFFGIDNGSYITKTYTYDDVVKALNTVQPYDWHGFLQSRIYGVAPKVPTDGITRGGYRIVYNDYVPEWVKHNDSQGASFSQSLGFHVNKANDVDDVTWGGLAFKAGMTPDMHIEAVTDQKYTVSGLREAIMSAEKNKTPVKLLLKRGDEYRTVSLDYHDGLRMPHLERVDSVPDRLNAILSPLK